MTNYFPQKTKDSTPQESLDIRQKALLAASVIAIWFSVLVWLKLDIFETLGYGAMISGLVLIIGRNQIASQPARFKSE